MEVGTKEEGQGGLDQTTMQERRECSQHSKVTMCTHLLLGSVGVVGWQDLMYNGFQELAACVEVGLLEIHQVGTAHLFQQLLVYHHLPVC